MSTIFEKMFSINEKISDIYVYGYISVWIFAGRGSNVRIEKRSI